MLDQGTADTIDRMTRKYWEQRVTEDGFLRLAAGKEIGHRIADMVDEETTGLIERRLTTRRQRKPGGASMPRSMGDIWVLSSGIYNPINVKAGESDKRGQPNMVSLKKLLRALLLRQIDSYYLLIVKMRLPAPIIVSVYLKDILDYLDHVTFDSGPGQIMLKERQFYEAVEAGTIPPPLTMDEKVSTLFRLLEDADRRLLRNRGRVMDLMRKMRDQFLASTAPGIDQTALNLQ
ncbi:MAG TPA: hypothetical protein VNL16_15135 [Chloroflexota bacterium]|nr:hypothetical protein [Chloroflexota bacterium]